MFCHICERDDVPSDQMNSSGYACKPCESDYINFRRAFKIEHGRWPTMQEFKQD